MSNIPDMAPAWWPTPQEIADSLPRRPLITDSSRPSLAQVLQLIADVAGNVEFELAGYPTASAGVYSKARYVVKLGVGARLELEFFPEQNQQTDSVGATLYAQYQQELNGLRSGMARINDPATVAATAAASAFAGSLPYVRSW